ncbi:MAG: hypothetical protein V2B20_01655 [Pseudomonadota bacterium]
MDLGSEVRPVVIQYLSMGLDNLPFKAVTNCNRLYQEPEMFHMLKHADYLLLYAKTNGIACKNVLIDIGVTNIYDQFHLPEHHSGTASVAPQGVNQRSLRQE